jgi:hypothetical protein
VAESPGIELQRAIRQQVIVALARVFGMPRSARDLVEPAVGFLRQQDGVRIRLRCPRSTELLEGFTAPG